MPQPDLDIATHLGASIGSLILGTNVFAGPVRPWSNTADADGGIPPESVFCLQRGGRADEVFHEGASPSFRHLAYPTVQIIVRTDASFQVGQSLAEQIFEVINHKPSAGYVEWAMTTSAPLYLGKEDDQHHEWSMNVSTIIDEVVA